MLIIFDESKEPQITPLAAHPKLVDKYGIQGKLRPKPPQAHK